LAFRFTLDEKDTETTKLPFFRVFPDGKDKQGRDASSSLATLKLARGESKLYKAEDAKPGLIVVLRRIVLVPLPSGDYRAILEGEFNAVQTRIAKDTMDKLLAGETTDLVIHSETTKGIRPVAFKVSASTRLRVAIKNDRMLCYGVEGGTTITHYGLLRDSTYESEPVSLEPEKDSQPVFIGLSVPPVVKADGSPETLPILN